ncbi:beach-domain-containing protein [Hortaea werneckii]|nr:beach-domain-containing protein [Hortaea werneckii]
MSRSRSSTGVTRGLDSDEQRSAIADTIRNLQVDVGSSVNDQVPRLQIPLARLKEEFRNETRAKDLFRRGGGFESILDVISKIAALKGEGLGQRVALAQDALFTLALGEYLSVAASEEGSADGDSPLESLSGTLQIYYPEAALLALQLALGVLEMEGEHPQEATKIVSSLLHTVTALADSSTRNAVALWNVGVPSETIRIAVSRNIPPEVKSGAHELTLALANFGLSSLDDVAFLSEQARTADNCRELLLEFLRRSKAPALIQFDLTLHGFSSIEMPCLPRAFPPTTGYTLTTWLRIDEYDPQCHTTLFGAFDASQTCFVLVYIEKDSHQLILQTSVRSSRPSVRFKSTRVDAGRWYHIAIVHRKASSDPRQSPALLFVNGEFAEQVKCGYPESPPEYDDRQSSGSPAVVGTRKSKPVQAFFGTPHDLALRIGRDEVRSRWSLASSHLYATPTSDEFLAVHQRLGPRYHGNLQDCLGPMLTYQASAELNRYNELLHPDKSEKSDIVTATESRGSDVVTESRLLLSISPHAVLDLDHKKAHSIGYELDARALARYKQLAQQTRGIALNAAIPTVNEAISRSYGSGILTGDPVVVIPKALDNASWCLAGALPLLARLLESANSKHAFLQAVKIFFECLKDNWRISEAMEKGNGYGMLAVIIREKLGLDTVPSPGTSMRRPATMLSLEDRQGLPEELLELILDFVGYQRSRPEDSMIVNPMAYRVLLIDFDTWRRCDIETQKLFYAHILHLLTRNRHQGFNQKRLTRMRVVRKLIEALKSEEISAETVEPLMKVLRALLDNHSGYHWYRDLAMFVVYGLHDERAPAVRPIRSMASIANLRHRTASWARSARSSRPSTPGGAGGQKATPGVSRPQLATHVLQLLSDLASDISGMIPMRRFAKAIPSRWLLHLLAETNVQVVEKAVSILSCCLVTLGPEYKPSFIEKNGGFVAMKARLKKHWNSSDVWLACFASFFGQQCSFGDQKKPLTLVGLLESFRIDDSTEIKNPEMLFTIAAMLEAGLRAAVKDEETASAGADLLKNVIQFLNEAYARSAAFRDFATNSRYVQELLFVLYPVLVGSDRLSAETELQAEKDTLSFKGEEVTMRPHSNSLGDRPPSVRSLNMDDDKRTPSSNMSKPVPRPRRLSSFIMVTQDRAGLKPAPAPFNAALAPKKAGPVALNIGNSIVESLLEVVLTVFVDLVCSKKKFQGIGLFLKVPSGFREHQAYFESYVLVNVLQQLWHHLQLNQSLFLDTTALSNLSRFSNHMAEAVFEGWFIDGAQPVLDFTGQLLEYLQQPDIASAKTVQLCSQSTSSIRVVFLRVTLWRLSELNETLDEAEAVSFLNKMNYWQTILFASQNQETLFIRLICYLLYRKLISEVESVRLAAARLWRTIVVQKPTEAATLLTQVVGSEQRHLSTGWMRLASMEDEEFIKWVDENRSSLDPAFVTALSKPWDDFVGEENKRNEETAYARLSKRREKLRQWQADEVAADDLMRRYEVSTQHWRTNVHAQERVKLQRATQDHQENVSHLFGIFARLDKGLKQPGGLEAWNGDEKWQLDETEAINRMRMRLLPDHGHLSDAFLPKRRASERNASAKLALNTQVSRKASETMLSPLPDSPMPATTDGAQEMEGRRMRADSASNSQLLEGGFEIVEDPNDDVEGGVEDKNRKIMTSLQRGDQVLQLYNISRIVGLEACEGLLVVGKKSLYLQDDYFQRADGEIVSASQAPEDERDPYVQLISGKDVGSQKVKQSVSDPETRHWTWEEVISVSKRRFLFRDVSIEVFFADGRSYLLTCISPKIRDDLYGAIVGRAPHVHTTSAQASEDSWRLESLRNPEEVPQSLGGRFVGVFSSTPSLAATKRWLRGDMSNFAYLMLINTMAGRTFNDLTQYPVFPWVLADYTSEELDLEDPRTFRDLSKPMGCQSLARAAEYQDRYRQFAELEDSSAPPFHYGTHYSSAMIVSSYLIRLPPYVQSYLLLQGGSFDHADRLFDSIGRAWASASRETMSDVRELTPEFFYLPEFLTNVNNYDFGLKQGSGGAVNDVQLPPWAKGDPHIFIAKHREALECPYVSERLHMWIGLVFGWKQRGEAAVEATNVFQHLSYHGSKDLDTITDPVERLATIGIIHSFGQTPHQVFQRPHPARELAKSHVSRLDTVVESLTRLPEPLFQSDERVAGLAFTQGMSRLLCDGPRKLNLPPNCDRFVQWGFADHSLRFFSSNTKRPLGLYENAHVGAVTSALFADRKTLITAGADCTIGVWSVHPSRDVIDLHPTIYLFGHRSKITGLTASRVFSTLVSTSDDGQILLWGLNRLNCIRTLHRAGDPTVQAVAISDVSGHIALCQGPYVLLYTLNGHLLLRQKVCDSVDDEMTCCSFYSGAGNEWLERELLFTGHARGAANVWALITLSDGGWHLSLVKRLNHVDANREDGGNTFAAVTAILPTAQAVYTGDESGRVWEWDCTQRQGSLSVRVR